MAGPTFMPRLNAAGTAYESFPWEAAQLQPSGYVNVVDRSATGLAATGPGRLLKIEVLSGSGSLQLVDQTDTAFSVAGREVFNSAAVDLGVLYDASVMNPGASDPGLPFINGLACVQAAGLVVRYTLG